jgi:hypothetical protein
MVLQHAGAAGRGEALSYPTHLSLHLGARARRVPVADVHHRVIVVGDVVTVPRVVSQMAVVVTFVHKRLRGVALMCHPHVHVVLVRLIL